MAPAQIEIILFHQDRSFNADGKPDILWRNAATGQNAVWYMNGVVLLGVADLPALPNPDYAIAGR